MVRINNLYLSLLGCAVTGCGMEELLIASYIVSWRDSTDDERLDPNNGILLSPNFDALFDKRLVSFENSGAILISTKLDSSQRAELGINLSASIEMKKAKTPYVTRPSEELR